MKHRLLTVVVALAAALATLAVAPDARAATGPGPDAVTRSAPVYWIDLFGGAEEHPRKIFFTANAGGYLVKVHWKDWGSRRTVGRGTFGTSAPCGDPMPACPDGPGKLVLTRPATCHPTFGPRKGDEIRVYRRAWLTYPDGEGGRKHTRVEAGWAACRES